MKKLLLLLLISGILIGYSCKKKDNSSGNPTPFAYKSLSATDTLLAINALTHIVADVSGDGLTYSWESSDLDGNNYGTIIGSGNDVQWSVCHSSRFKVSCTITDKYSNSGTKTVYIHTF